MYLEEEILELLKKYRGRYETSCITLYVPRNVAIYPIIEFLDKEISNLTEKFNPSNFKKFQYIIEGIKNIRNNLESMRYTDEIDEKLKEDTLFLADGNDFYCKLNDIECNCIKYWRDNKFLI